MLNAVEPVNALQRISTVLRRCTCTASTGVRGWCLRANQVSKAFISSPFPGRRERRQLASHLAWHRRGLVVVMECSQPRTARGCGLVNLYHLSGTDHFLIQINLLLLRVSTTARATKIFFARERESISISGYILTYIFQTKSHL